MWNPDVYLKYADERGRHFHDLVNRVNAEKPRVIEDLGCGPGNLTETLAQRWPQAKIRGIDSSPEMIASAPQSTVEYVVGDVNDYVPADDVDLIVSNAMLQWVDDPDTILRNWVKPGRWIAAQMPANYDAPSHQLLRQVCDSPRWASQLAGFNDRRRVVGSAVHYARLLREAGADHIDTWETTYIHQLPVKGADHPVLTWMSGTAMRPVRNVLSDQDYAEFCEDLNPLLNDAYPVHNRIVDFPFLRVFLVGYRQTS